mgnify:CR=1 FL=1
MSCGNVIISPDCPNQITVVSQPDNTVIVNDLSPNLIIQTGADSAVRWGPESALLHPPRARIWV